MRFVTGALLLKSYSFRLILIEKILYKRAMHSVNLICHDFFVMLSFVASIAGLILLWDKNQQIGEIQQTERILFRMSFSYWLVYCVAFGIEKTFLPSGEVLLMSLRMTTALSYFLTFSCIICLPLHKFAMRRIED